MNLDQSVKLQEISEKVMQEFPEVQATFSRIGTSEIATERARARLSILAPLALAIVFMMIFAVFRSLLLTLLILPTIYFVLEKRIKVSESSLGH